MSLIKPFAGLRPDPAHVAGVIAPPYDVLSTEEARERARGKPNSFLHISKPEIDLPPGTNPYSRQVYEQARKSFARMRSDGVLHQDAAPFYYVYRLVMGDHKQTGLVAVASVKDYESGRIRKHEFTRPDKEDDRVRQIEALDAQTGPVFLTYRQNEAIDRTIDQICAPSPEVDVTADNGVRHSLWVVRDETAIEGLTKSFDSLTRLYIADGHHRSAAAARVARARRAAGGARGDHPACEYFLSVIFPDNQMQILDYNRVVRDLNGLSSDKLLGRLAHDFTVERVEGAAKPERVQEFGLYVDHCWYRLRAKPERVPNDPVGRLDVSLLQSLVIDPVLGITDPRRDQRIDFVGGIRGLAELQRRVDLGEMALAFALYPTSMADLMAVADVGEVMPPKSTWFEPKLADGLVSHVF